MKARVSEETERGAAAAEFNVSKSANEESEGSWSQNCYLNESEPS